MKFSVVIPTFNRRDLLARTLPTVLEQDYPAEDFEVLVVVDGSTDGTVAFLRQIETRVKMRILEQPNSGCAAARNAGLLQASGQWVIFVDDDTICPKSLLREHEAAHSEGDPSVVRGRVLWSSEDLPSLATDFCRNQYVTQKPAGDAAGYLSYLRDLNIAVNSSVPRTILLEAGGYDSCFRGALEDYDLAFRLHRRGIPFRDRPAATVHQIQTKSARRLIGDQGNYGRNQIRLCRKYPEYRQIAALRRLGDPSPLKRLALWIIATLPFSPDVFLRVPYGIAERFRKSVRVRRAGTRLLKLRCYVELIRNAVAECGSWRAALDEFGLRLPVLLYHHIGEPGPEVWEDLAVSQKRFASHLKWLERLGYRAICPSDWLAWVTHGKTLPSKCVLLTFDDAYAELIEYALPLLRQHECGAAVYVVTGLVGKTNEWDQANGFAPLRLMDAESVRTWAGRGIQFGAHSRTHADLSKLNGQALENEVEGSGNDLRALLGWPVESFAYPFGLYSEDTAEQARKSFAMAFTVAKGMNSLQTDLYRLRRSVVSPDDWGLDIFFRLHCGWSPWRSVVNRLRRMVRPTVRKKA